MESPDGRSWMADLNIFVDPDAPEAKQAASFATVSKLLLEQKITIEDVVTRIGKYLTATDKALRARGIILLGELLAKLASTPLEDVTIQNLAIFFTARLADWHCLRGALIGSIALLKRCKQVGRVEENEVKSMARVVLQDLHVQALGLTDRLLSLEMYKCLLNIHAASVKSLGGELVYAVCAAIEGEKDPRCLLLAFHLAEQLVQLFPASDGPLADHAEELFDLVSRYFPVSFTPPPNDRRGISRKDLADALLNVFTSTPLFAPFCIPVLIEKLYSSLQSAKLDSLRYLGHCALSFGPKAVSQHVDAIWQTLKAELIPKTYDKNDVQTCDAALICLTRCVEASQKDADEGKVVFIGNLVKLVCEDECIEDIFRFIKSDLTSKSQSLEGSYLEGMNAMLNKRASEQIRAAGYMLAAVVKASPSSCHIVTDKIMNRLILASGISSLDSATATDCLRVSRKGSLSALGLEVIIQIIEGASRVAEGLALLSTSSPQLLTNLPTKKWLEPLCLVAPKLLWAFSQVTSGQALIENHSKLGVAGLQALASFPAVYSPLTEEELQHLLSILVDNVLLETSASDDKDTALKAIVITSTSEGKFTPPPRTLSSTVVNLVIPRLLKAVQQAHTTSTVKVPLNALSAVAHTQQIARQAVLSGLRQILAAQFPELESASNAALQNMVKIFECLSQEVIPLCEKGSTDQMIACDLVLDIWSVLESLCRTTYQMPDEVLSSTMAVNRVMTQSGNQVVQEQILSRATSVLLEWDMNDTVVNASTTQDEIEEGTIYTSMKFKRERGWLVALVASIVLGLSPSVVFLKHQLLKIFIKTSISDSTTLKSGIAAQATASLLNKWKDSSRGNGRAEGEVETLDEAIREAVDQTLMPLINKYIRDYESTVNVAEESVSMEIDKDKVVRAVLAMAWIGKGLAMRGHTRISDIAAAFLGLLQLESTNVATNDAGGDCTNLASVVSQAAAKSIGIIVKDSRRCFDIVDHAVVRPLFKQRFFTSMLPPLQSAVRTAGIHSYRIWFFRAFGHLLSGMPQAAVLTEGQKVFPLVLEGLSVLANNSEDSELLLSTLLSLSSFLTDGNDGRNIAAQHVPAMVKRLTTLVQYRASLMIRETALECLAAIAGLPFTSVYPEKPKVMKAINATLDDHKRRVRKEAVHCRQVWSAIST